MNARLGVVATLAVVALVPGAQQVRAQGKPAAKAKPAGVYERSVVEVAPAGKLSVTAVAVDNRLGSVRIEGHDGDKVVIQAVKRAQDNATLDRLKVSLVSDPDGGVRIGTSIATGRDLMPIPRGSVRVDLVVRAPRSARANARVWNGKVSVIGMENGAKLIANEGDIQVYNSLGTFVTSSAQGKQELQKIVGSVDARGLIGDMELAMIRGKRLAAAVHNGNIVGRKIHMSELALRTMKGNIVLHAEVVLGGRYNVSTYEGNVQISFGNKIAMNIRARAPRGDITLPPQLRPAKKTHDGTMAASYQGSNPAIIDVYANVGHVAFAF